MILWRAYRWTYLSFSPEGQSNIHTTAKKKCTCPVCKGTGVPAGSPGPRACNFCGEEVV